jgi:3-phenylpropionate/trans-cinnamate dioxygenase ferredoxin reductase component
VAVTEFRSTGHVTAVITNDGHQILADVVIVEVGARPNTELAERAGLTVNNGVLVDTAVPLADTTKN